jgi:hypothetical protein
MVTSDISARNRAEGVVSYVRFRNQLGLADWRNSSVYSLHQSLTASYCHGRNDFQRSAQWNAL